MTAAVEPAARQAVQAAAARIAARVSDVPGVSVMVEGDTVTVTARALSRRRIEEPALRRVTCEGPALRRPGGLT